MNEDQRFPANMKRLREAKEMSQTELARQMKDAGFPYHQQTVQRVESGERPVRLAEAFAIARCLGARVEHMTQGEGADQALDAAREVERTAEALKRAASDYYGAKFMLGLTMEKIPLKEMPFPLKVVGRESVPKTVEDVIREWRKEKGMRDPIRITRDDGNPTPWLDAVAAAEQSIRDRYVKPAENDG
ncbi:helix-turn-helix transcriptional regulator (plasmid) [Coraliomargarita sp. W4R53]